MSSKEPVREFFNIAQAAVYAGVSRDVMALWVAKKWIPFYELPTGGLKRFVKISKNDIDVFLKQYRKGKA